MAVSSTLALHRLAGLSIKDLVRVLATRSFEYAPKVVKYFVLLLFLCQARSWPLVWHFSVWSPVFAIRGKYYFHRLKYIFSSAAVRREKNLEWLENLSNVGANPFELCSTYSTWASPDDCDFNLHLSNSSYPKRLDTARFKFALEITPTLFRVGGWMALGATHFTFLREIPMFARYEMRSSIMSWDHKWMYVVTRFVTKPKKGGKKHAHKPLPSPTPLPPSDAAPNPSLHTASGVVNGTSDPTLSTSGTSSPSPNANGIGPVKALAAQFIDRPEPDGATVNCLCISEVCCKIGRITVPPSLVLAVDGHCCAPPPSSSSSSSSSSPSSPKAYSRTNPPPHWETVRALRGDAHAPLDRDKGGLRVLRDFYTSAWREVPEGERWWESALGAEVEERRLRALPCMQALRKGVEEARSF